MASRVKADVIMSPPAIPDAPVEPVAPAAVVEEDLSTAHEDFEFSDYSTIKDRAGGVSFAETAEWVAANLHQVGVRPCDAPSRATWSMLLHARSSKAAESSFWTQIHKTAAKDAGADGFMGDDGREIEGLIVDHLRALGESA